MSDTAASFDDVTLLGGRGIALGDIRALVTGLLGSAATGVMAVVAVGVSAAVATTAGLWMVGVALSGNTHLQTRQSGGPARLALADPMALPPASFEARWARTTAVAQARPAARKLALQVAEAGSGVPAPLARSQVNVEHEAKVTHEIAAPALPRVAELTPPVVMPRARPHIAPEAHELAVARVALMPLPRSRPVLPEIAEAPVDKPAEKVAMVAPPPAPAVEKRAAPRVAHNRAPALPGPQSRTALYDIAGHTVYMPDGTRLEAHSGLGGKIDDPRFIKVRMRGPTPPNVYDLTLRERLFHGVRAIRLTPQDEHKMFGRDGMLAHTYMLGPNGQSNGCVSFKDYDRFLNAFLNGKVDRMVVVRNLDEAPTQLATLVRAPRDGGYRYAANEASPATW